MKDVAQRFTSRKFLITLGLIVALTLWPDMPDSVLQLALVYLGAEGLHDVVAAWRQPSVDVAKVELKQAKVNAGWTQNIDAPVDQQSNKVVPGQ